MTLIAGIFERAPDFENVIHEPGKNVIPPPRPWTRLRNDPRVEAFIGASLEELHERNQNAERGRQIEAQVRKSAAEQGIPVGEARARSTVTMPQQPPKAVVDPEYDARKANVDIQKSIEEASKELQVVSDTETEGKS